MVVRREKKRKYRRGYRTHGWGRVGQHRRSGYKGGRGNVGFHKHKWSWTVKYAPDWYGKHGFIRPPSITPLRKGINIGVLDEIAEKLVEKGIAKKENDTIIINIKDLGYNRLLGSGRISKKLHIITPHISRKAKQKLEEAGVKITIIGG
ncbi:MAG: 50S ribosomal protein L15 [Candidatus Aenigmatarchaeota archaeon]|nr:MAG: 50S ribosomal protein L15 [Candidatus Aenigmarchaeota archaeon]